MPVRQPPSLTPPFNEAVLDASGRNFTPAWAKYFEALGNQATVIANLHLANNYGNQAEAAIGGVGIGELFLSGTSLNTRTA